MCGICGFVGKFKESEKKVYLKNMLGSLEHRGPDEERTYFDEDLSFGIRRLSVIDLNTGSQPIFNEKRDIVIVCNGEIYNFLELKEKLTKKGHMFYTNSDVEVIPHLYEDYGVNCLNFLRGMFAFALWNKEREILFLARDRFGIKPLYYYNKNGAFAFASELKALLTLPFVSKQLNNEAVDLYFSLEYIPSPHSILKDIYKLRPAHFIIYKDGNLKTSHYWRLQNRVSKKIISFSEAKEQLSYLLKDAVEEHLISDVPWGIFLSGGIDSTTLVAFANDFSSHSISTFSIGFKEKSFDESGYIHIVSQYFNTRHHLYIFTIDEYIRNFYEIIKCLDEPFADFSIFPTYILSKFSREYVKVALSGEGADELFMGYPTYIAHRYINIFNKLPQLFKRILRYSVEMLPTSSKYFSIDFKLKQFVRGIGECDYINRHLLWMNAFAGLEKDSLFTESLKREIGEGVLNSFIREIMAGMNFPNTYKSVQYLDLFTYLSQGLLVKTDTASMLASLEVRVPYLDHRLVEFVWSLNHNFIYQKRLLKNAVKGVVPYVILSRPKKGFPIPFSMWFRNHKFLKTVEGFFDKEFINKQGMFNYSYIKSLLKEHLSGRKDNRKKLRTYIMFQAWFRSQFL